MGLVSLVVAFALLLPWVTWAEGVRMNHPVTIVGPVNYGTDAGGDDTYACALDPPLGGSAYVAGACYQCQVATANTGAATINFDGLGAVAITKVSGGVTTALVDNDIRAGHLLQVCFDGTQFQCQNCEGNISSAAAPGFLPDGTAASFTCGTGTGGQIQIGPDSLLEYCGYEATPLLHISGLPQGLSWGDTGSCGSDENFGKLTVISGVIQCGPDVADATTAAWNDGGATSLTCGGVAQGQHQVLNTGRLEYCGGEDVSVLYAGYLLPSPLSFNINAATCTGDTNSGKLTINGANQVVCATDVVGEGGEGTGDLTAFGSCATGDCATTGSPLTSAWWGAIAAPSAPAAGQLRQFPDQTAKNLCVIADDGAIKCLAQAITATEHFFLTSFAGDGAFGAARPSSASLTDGATLAKLTEPQSLEAKQIVSRVCQLAATSGSLTPNLDLCDVVYRYDVAGQVDVQTPTATGLNPRHEQALTFDFYAASAQTITWTAAYAGNYSLALPTTLPAGRYVAFTFRYNTGSSKYELWAAHDPRAVASAVLFQGSTDGVVTMQPQASAGTYNWNLPIAAGSSGQVLTSGGGGATAMTWTTLAGGATATSTTVGQVLRVGTGPTIAYGAVDLADADAVTNVLPVANGGTGLASGTSGGILAYTASGTLASSGALTANMPVIGGGAGVAPTVGTRSGNTTAFVTTTGTQTSGDCVEIDGNGNHVASGDPCGTGSGGAGTIHLSVGGYSLPPTNPAQLDASENNLRLLFDASTSECAIWQGRMNADYAGSPVVKFPYSMTSATTGGVSLDVSVMAVTPGDSADINTDSYATVNNCDDATVPGTAGFLDAISCTLTNDDGLAANDFFKIKICRAVADAADTATGDLEGVAPSLEYAR